VDLTLDGKRVSLYGRSRQEVEQKRALRLAHHLERRLDPQTLTFKGWAERWLEDKQREVRPASYEVYAGHMRRYLVPALGHFKLSEIRVPHINELLYSLPVAPGTKKSVRSTLRTCLQDAVRAELILTNPASLSRPPKATKRAAAVFSQQQARRFLDACEGHFMGLLLMTAVMTGMRQGELIGLRWHNVSLSQPPAITVAEAMQRKRGGQPRHLGEPKTAQSVRTVPIPSFLAERLRHEQRRQTAIRRADPDWNPDGFVFVTRNGKPFHDKEVYTQFSKLLERYQLPKLRFHDLRHTAATLMVEMGTPIEVVSKILGHSTIRLTVDTYAHISPVLMEQAAQRMNTLVDTQEE
jgi:integrase